MTKPTLREISGLGAILARYQGLICDLWGVMHNGIAPYPGSIAAIEMAKDAGVPLVFLSNAPRLPLAVGDQLTDLGIDPILYRGIVTSGLATREAIELGDFGRRFWFLGPARTRGLIEGLDIEAVDLAQAQAILCTGLFDDEVETPADYTDRLKQAADRGLPMICANPDLNVVRGQKMIYCAGAVAEHYTDMGGVVTAFGKPHRPVFDLALAQLGCSAAEALMIGDGLRTDIRGAHTAGIDSWLIAGGIHGAELGIERDPLDLDRISALAKSEGGQPQYVSRRFSP
jgi:HAD superfamily hydrolase (TIGR01459 family)